jgi:quinol monooxygenase YgiN
MITILFHMTVKSGREQEFVDLALRLTPITRAEDEGCLAYVYLRDKANPLELVLYEQWRDQAALDAHIAHLVRLLGAPRPGDVLPAAFMDPLEKTWPAGYDVIA